jgi:Yip1-like protein
MEPPSVQPAPPSGGITDNSLGRVAGALWKPRETFASIAARPTWAVALLVIVAASTLVTVLWIPKIDVAEMVRDRIASSGQSVPADRIESAVALMSRLKWAMFLGPVLILQPIVIAGAAFVFYLVFRVVGSEQSYRQSLGVTVHAFLPLAIASLLAVPILLGRDSLSTEEVMSGGVLASNLGFLAPEDASPAIRALLQSLDFFTLWTVILLFVGYRQSSRLSKTSVAISVVCVWGLWVLLRMGLASLGSMVG